MKQKVIALVGCMPFGQERWQLVLREQGAHWVPWEGWVVHGREGYQLQSDALIYVPVPHDVAQRWTPSALKTRYHFDRLVHIGTSMRCCVYAKEADERIGSMSSDFFLVRTIKRLFEFHCASFALDAS